MEDHERAPRRGQRILVVDDDPAFLSAMVRTLEVSYGFDVSLAPNASAAIILGRCRRFDAAIVDVILMGSSGLELIPQLRQEHEARYGKRIPVILVSGEDPDIWGTLVDEADIDIFIGKPMNIDRVVEALDFLLE